MLSYQVDFWSILTHKFKISKTGILSVRSLDRDPVEENIPEVSEDYDGMMDALVDIQEKGDNMMAGIWWQKEILTKLENSLQEAEVKMEAAEERNEELDEAKYQLETEVLELETKREELMSRMSLDEQHIVRLGLSIEPAILN